MTLDSLKALTENPWFKFGGRVAMWASPVLLSGVLWLLADIRSKTVDAVAAIKSDVAQVVEVQGERADVADDNFAGLSVEVQEVKGDVGDVRSSVNGLNLKYERIAGALEAMAGRSVVGSNWRPQSAPAHPVN